MNAKALPYIFLTGLAFGTSLIASRFGVGQMDPVTFVTIRLVLASMGFFAIYLLDHRRHSWPTQPQLWKHSLIVAPVGPAIQMTAILFALRYLSSGVVAILVTLFPVVIVLMAHVFLPEERLNRRHGFGVLLALVGALILAGRHESGLPDIVAGYEGYAWVLLALLGGGIETVYTRKYMQEFDSFDVTSLRMLTSAVIMAIIAIFWTGIDLSGVDRIGYLSLLYATLIGAMVAMLLRFYIIQRFGATTVATSNYIIPIVAALGGVLLLGEVITVWMFLGMAIILVGIAFIIDTPPRAREKRQYG